MFVGHRDPVGVGIVEERRVVAPAGDGKVDRIEQVEPVLGGIPRVADVAVDVPVDARGDENGKHALLLPLRREGQGVFGAARSETQVRLVVELPFLALVHAVGGAVLEGLAAAVGEPGARLVGPAPVERGQGDGPPMVAPDGVRPLVGVGETDSEDETVGLHFGVRPPPHQVEARVRRRRDARLDVDGAVAMAVPLPVAALLARRRDAVRADAGGVHGGVVAVASGAEARGAARRAEGPRLGLGGNLGRAASPPGDDVDDAADRVAAPQRALGAAQHLDALDSAGEEIAEVEFGTARWIVDLDPVDQHQGLVRFRAPDADLREGAGPSRTADGDAGDLAQDLADGAVLPGVDVVAVDDGRRAADRRRRDGYAAGGDHDFRQHLDLRRRAFRGGAEDRRRGAEDEYDASGFGVESHGWLPNLSVVDTEKAVPLPGAGRRCR